MAKGMMGQRRHDTTFAGGANRAEDGLHEDLSSGRCESECGTCSIRLADRPTPSQITKLLGGTGV